VEEYRAGQYITQKLQAANLTDVQEHPFFAVGKLSERLGPVGLLAGAGMLVGASSARWRRVTGALLVLGAALSARQILKGQAPPWETIYPQRRSQNVLAKIAPQGEVKERLVLLAHVDTDHNHLTQNPRLRDFAPYFFSGVPNSILLGSVLTLFNAPLWLRYSLAYAFFGGVGVSVIEEMGQNSLGANDNAAGVAMLIALAQHLQQNPLNHTEVVLSFTGCGTVSGQGAAALAAEFANPWAKAWWLSLDSIGAGELCWVSSHGLSQGLRYKPHGDWTELLTQLATQNPQLGLMGRPMTTLDDVAPLRAKGLKAAGLMGYDRASGHPKHWDQAEDAPNHIQPEALGKTWTLLQAILREIDKPGR
jgi:hypothetical protein